MPNWAQNGPKWSKTCYIDHLGSFWALLDRFGTSASLPCSAIFGPKRAIMIRGSQKGGGSDVWEKFPNNVVFLFESVPIMRSTQCKSCRWVMLAAGPGLDLTCPGWRWAQRREASSTLLPLSSSQMWISCPASCWVGLLRTILTICTHLGTILCLTCG